MEKALLGKSAAQGLRSLQSWITYEKTRLANYEKSLRAEIEKRGGTMTTAEKNEFQSELTTTIMADVRLSLGQRHSSLLAAARRAGLEPDTDSRERRGMAGGTRKAATETRAKPTTIYGHAAVFNEETVIAGLFRERIAPGAFKNCLDDLERSDMCVCLMNHNADLLLGRYSTGGLTLKEDKIGLFYECFLADTQNGRDVYEDVREFNLVGNSFSFTVLRDRWELAQQPGQIDLRTITEIGDLYDVGPVTYPAYVKTDVHVSRQNYLLDHIYDEIEAEKARALQAKATRQRLEALEKRLAQYRKK